MTSIAPPQIKDPIESFDYCEPELIIGMVCAVGAEYGSIRDYLTATFAQYGYKTHSVRISSLIPKLTDFPLVQSPEFARIKTHIEAGNRGCYVSGRKDLWALAAIADINAARDKEEHGHDFFVQKPLPRMAHIILTLSRAEELHQDAIVIEEKAPDDRRKVRRKVPFTPFVGVGPRRYFDLFSLNLSRGFELVRKRGLDMVEVSRQGSFVRVPMSPLSYIQREGIAIKQLEALPKQLDNHSAQEGQSNENSQE